MLIALVILFNILVSLGFISSNIYMWNYLKTEINDITPAAYIEKIDAFQVSISHPYINDTVNLGPLPTVIPNYPFILFWISTIGNLILITLALVLRNKASKQKLAIEFPK